MKISSGVLTPLVILSFVGIILAANLWELPTQQHSFQETDGEAEGVEMIVNGLLCRGISNFFTGRLSKVEGVVSLDTYVQEHRAVITYDPAVISVGEIKGMIETSIRLRDGRLVRPFTVKEILE